MAKINFEVRYQQPDDSAINGTIFLDVGVANQPPLSQAQLASGRLDTIGATVVAEGFNTGTFSDNFFDIVIECQRTSTNAMTVRLVFFGTIYSYEFYDDNNNHITTPNSGPVLEKVIEDVPLDFNG